MIDEERLKEIAVEEAVLCGTEETQAMATELLAAREELAALRWRKISPESLPKVGDEALCESTYPGFSGYCVLSVDEDDAAQDCTSWTEEGWTHYRPINAPPKEEA